MLDSATELEINFRFHPVSIGPELPDLRKEIIKDISTDQYYAYMMVKGVRAGVLPDRLARLEIGPVNHLRLIISSESGCPNID